MAIWQYNFQLISRNHFKDINLQDIVKNLEIIFGNILEQDDNKIMLGNYESNDCTVYMCNNLIDSIFCRLDMRIINQKLINDLKNIAEKFNFDFLVIEEKVLTGKELIDNLKNSSAASFVENPEFF